jgi:hypothetical protein
VKVTRVAAGGGVGGDGSRGEAERLELGAAITVVGTRLVNAAETSPGGRCSGVGEGLQKAMPNG